VYWSLAGTSPHEEAEKVLKPLRDVAEVKAEQIKVMPFPALQSALAHENDSPNFLHGFCKY
jgi:hypothetical protein